MPLGLYGKYPGKRDFISVNLPRPLMEVIEKWSHAGMAASRDALRDEFAGFYMIQPIWSFRLGALVAGTDCAGALMPSVDGVGRSFPLIVVSYASSRDQALAPANPGIWFPQAHACLLAALEDDAPGDPGSLVAGLEDHPAGEGSPLESRIVPAGEGGIGDAIGQIDTFQKSHAGRDRTLWWTEGGEHVRACAAGFPGMPEPSFMIAMMASDRAAA